MRLGAETLFGRAMCTGSQSVPPGGASQTEDLGAGAQSMRLGAETFGGRLDEARDSANITGEKFFLKQREEVRLFRTPGSYKTPVPLSVSKGPTATDSPLAFGGPK